MKKTIIVSIIVVVLALAGIGYWKFTGKAVATLNYDNFAKCLTENGVIMYGSKYCPHCLNQKKMFGDSFKYINYVECADNPTLCTERSIQVVPTWSIKENLYTGEKTIEELSSLAGCKI